MLEIAQREIPVYFEKVKECLAQKNQVELVNILHKLKGASLSSGMKKVGNICKDLENKAKENNFMFETKRLGEIIAVSLKELENFYSQHHKELNVLSKN